MGQMYFGNLRRMQMVTAALSELPVSTKGYSEVLSFQNGGADVVSSFAGARTFDMSWSGTPSEINPFKHYQQGYYGPGLLYMVDPMTEQYNTCLPNWASPYLIEVGDWKNIYTGNPTFSDVTGATFTNLATNPSFETASGTITVRTNLATHPIPDASWSSGFGVGGAGSASNVADARFPGGLARKTTWTTAPTGTSSLYTESSSMPVTAGQSVMLSTHYAVENWAGIVPDFYAPGGTMGTKVVTDLGGGLFRLSRLWTQTSATSVSVNFAPVGTLPTTASSMSVGGSMIESSPALGDYFDGSSPAAGDFSYGWTGAAKASTSIQTAPGLAATGSARASSVQSTAWSLGGRSLRSIPNNVSNDSYAAIGGDGGGIRLGMQAGRTYTVIATFRQESPQVGSLNPVARSITGWWHSGASYFKVLSQAPNVAGSAELRLTFTIPADANEAFIRLYNGASIGNGDVWWDDFAIVEGAYDGPYFDGNVPDNGEHIYAWTGTADASTSTMTDRYPSYNQPTRAAKWTVDSAAGVWDKAMTLPIPPGKTLWLGASGSATGTAQIGVQPIFTGNSVTTDAIQPLTLLDPNGATRMNASFDGNKYKAVQVFIRRTDSSASTLTLVSMMSQIWPTGVAPVLTGEHVPGEGFGGMKFASSISESYYQAAGPGHERKGASVQLVEVESWQ